MRRRARLRRADLKVGLLVRAIGNAHVRLWRAKIPSFHAKTPFRHPDVLCPEGAGYFAAFGSRMMFSRASMISDLSTLLFVKLIRRRKVFVGARNAKTNGRGRAIFAFDVSVRASCRVTEP